ncbi:DUF1345 domain-containing protein [Kineosporia sp. R_H_3]|uniref:DUF1345 domain-containing protein n=1 Tax=Kineosporia sp. R_H_3 TaxID=1961848 RepID=UPI0018E9E2CD|nr:DUF1345 domain-containing protein [Kineosporia sp. R_H_3]
MTTDGPLPDPADEAAHAAMHARMRAGGRTAVPAWLRETAGEPRWQAMVAVVVMIALQLRLPDALSAQNAMPVGLQSSGRWLLPGLQALLGVVLVVANPRDIKHASPGLRLVTLTLLGVASLANAISAVSLVTAIVSGAPRLSAQEVLLDGGTIWLTNILVFGLWYWELDRGGPRARARAERRHPDFLFPEMTNPDVADPDWEPHVVDYLYVAFTNATAFSPTDTVPFSRWSKLAMTLQSTVSLAVGALVIARAVNALG